MKDLFFALDGMVSAIAIMTYMLVTGIFLAKAWRKHRLEKDLGWAMIVLGVPTLGAVVVNLFYGREWWLVALPIGMVTFCAVEVVVDYWLKSNFRQTRWVAAYLVLFYMAMIGLLGYVFAVGRSVGQLMVIGALGTYLLSLFFAWFAYKKVGHGSA